MLDHDLIKEFALVSAVSCWIGLFQVDGSPDPSSTGRVLSPHPPCGGVQLYQGIIGSGEGFFPVGRAAEILINGRSAGGIDCPA